MSAVLVQESVTREVIGAFYAVYNGLGFGFLEAVYANALELELRRRGKVVERELPIDVSYRGSLVGFYRADLVVDKVVLVEIKSARILDPHVRQQALNYLRGTNLEVALILHFGPKPHFERLISTR
jgi:GxxExxY protein